jgi:hypothetical protein
MKSKIMNKIRLLTLGVAMLSSVISTPVFADENYSGRMIVPRTNNVPQFFIRRIDITYNQIEFAYAIGLAGAKTIAKFGVGWVADDSLAGADVRTYNFGDPGIQTVFWSGNEVISDFASADVGYFKTYTVDSDVDLNSNTSRELFYYVEFTNGEVWMNKASYTDCGNSWTMGKSCNKAYYMNDKEIDSVVYQLENVPETKFQRKYTPVAEPEPESEPTQDPEPTTALVPEPEPVAEPELPESEPVVTEFTESNNISGDKEEARALIAKVASTVKYATDTTSTDTDDEEDIDEDDEDEIMDSNEGFGDTTLDVPVLGGVSKCDELNFWPYLLLGFGGGIFSALVLSYIKKANKTLSTIR